MSIIERAKAELDRIKFGEEDSAVMVDILERFFKQWDSGGTVSVAGPVLARLIEGKPLAPLTGADDEWIDCSEMRGCPMWQNLRCSSVFKDGSRAWDIDLPGNDTITFPYRPGYRPMPADAPRITREPDPDEVFFGGEQWTPEQQAAMKAMAQDAVATGRGVLEINRIPMGDFLDTEQEIDMAGQVEVALDRVRAIMNQQREQIRLLREQLEAEGAHTAAANARIDEMERAKNA
jgi:hypothetical protein